jgi:eukaryotic-like serine/threonine-protein kinase
MLVTANSSLGPYKILSPVGAGGMGEVYKALDTRLHREVAVKVMSAEFASHPDRRARFEREARAVAALNHPNIVAVYDIGDENGLLYSVSELVLGETLRARLGRPPISVREAIDIATQIANGMAAAHAAGITHRDLKPENIMINREGQVKILDFGLARQNDPATLAADAETGFAPNTQAGAILGTASYMSPEQARGEAVDYRSDQFSFGLVVYEMVSGAKAFERESAIQTMAAILNEDVPQITVKIPAPFRWIVERCLSKDPRFRYDSTRDLYQELRNLGSHLSEALTSSSEVLPASESPVSRPRARLIYFVVAALAVALAAALAFAFQIARKPDPLKYRYSPLETTGNPGGAVWAPDGKAFVYEQTTGGKAQMYIRYLNSPTASALGEQSSLAYPLAWTPDSRRIFFLALDSTQSKPKFVVSSIAAVGGEADSITSVDLIPIPCISPDGKTMAVFRKGDDGLYGLFTSSPIGAPYLRYAPAPFATKTVFNGASVQFSPNGRKILLTLTNENGEPLNWLIPFPAGSGAPRVVLRRVPNATGGTLSASWMPDSRHVAVDHDVTPGAPNHISVADTESDSVEPITSGLSDEGNPRVSPDGRKLLFTSYSADDDIVSVALDGSSVTRLIETSRNDSMPAWASNIRRLIYVTDRNGPPEIWIRREDGSDHPLVTPKDFPNFPIRWFMTPTLSPDGTRAIYVALPIGGVARLWISSLNGGSPIPLTTSAATVAEFGGAWSPDGNRFVYLNVADGKNSLMIARTSGQASPVRIAEAKGFNIPSWSPDGQWISLRQDQWMLISPDGKNTKSVGDIATVNLAFSRDSKTLYGVKPAPPNGQNLFSIDIATNKVTVIKDLGAENAPASPLWRPGIRFSLSPDGKSIVYGVLSPRTQSSLWMLEGFAKPSLLETLHLR